MSTEDEKFEGISTSMGSLSNGISYGQSMTLRQNCDAPAPLVVNGGNYVGCPLPADHDGDHEVKVRWPR